VGFTGRDILKDTVYEGLVELVDTKLNQVKIMAAAADEKILRSPPARPLVVATEFAFLADRWLSELGLAHVILHSHGSTEAYCPRFADLIVDVVETGDTLRANGLTPIHDFGPSSTVMITRQALTDRADVCALADTVREQVQ